jgi:hypothetical protein
MTNSDAQSLNDTPPPLPEPQPYPGGDHVASTLKFKATKAQVGTILGAITVGATAAAQQLPSPWDGYVTTAVAIAGLVATFFGIYIPTNKVVAK